MDQSTPWRFSLRTLLVATALVAVAYAPAGWLGAAYTLSVTASLLLLAYAYVVLSRRKTGDLVLACVTALLPAMCFLPFGSFSLGFQAAGIALLALGTSRYADRPSKRFVACALVTLVGYVPMVSHAMASDRRVDRMRQTWPVVSVRSRLPEPLEGEAQPTPSLTVQQEKHLLEREDLIDRRRWRGMATLLQRLHHTTYKRFARSPGFGFMRMGPVTQYRLEHADHDRAPAETGGWPVALASRADRSLPTEIHKQTELVFTDGDRLGHVEDLDHVAGFLGHGFARLPYDNERRENRETDSGKWQLNRLDLIGLVLHEEPSAYVTEGLPNMEALRDAPTRDLDGFESAALDRLNGPEDVVVQETHAHGERHVRMLGAIRAGESCAACHQTPRGTLLGAFSYELTHMGGPEAASPIVTK